MLSTDEIAFEPDSQKTRALTSAIAALWSGDASVQAEILHMLERDVQVYLAQDEDRDWLEVQHVTEVYVAHWNTVRRKRAAAAILEPLGLTIDSFREAQRSMDTNMVQQLTNALIGYALPRTSCIIAGVDSHGAHVWEIHDGAHHCADLSGFAAIGAGTRHATSQMMQGRHSPAKSPSETLVLVHLAKKRAEVSPSVGSTTDIVLIGPILGQTSDLPQNHLDKLDANYAALQAAESLAFTSAVAEFDAYLSTIAVSPPSVQDPEGVEG
jgi:hypothetical protein